MRYSTFYIQVDDVSLDTALRQARAFLSDGKQHYIVTPNPEMVMLAKRDPSFRKVFIDASLSLIDGVGLLLGMRLFGIRVRHRVTGVDFTERFLQSLVSPEPVYILGGEMGASARCAEALRLKGVNIVGTYEPDRKTYLSNEQGIVVNDNAEHLRIVQSIRDSHARILLVALGHGKQEKWLHTFLKHCPEVSIGVGVGGTIDYFSGDITRAPFYLRKVGLEWCWRLLRQPW